MNEFRNIRRKSGLSMTEFSREFGIPYRTVQNWEAGCRKPSKYLLDLIKFKVDRLEER